MAKKKKNKPFLQKFFFHYRLVIMSDENFEEKISLRLSRANVLLFTLIFSIVLITGTCLTIAYTPLKELLPGVLSKELKQSLYTIENQMDSIQQWYGTNQKYVSNIESILKNKIDLSSTEHHLGGGLKDLSESTKPLHFRMEKEEEQFIREVGAEIESRSQYKKFLNVGGESTLLPPLDKFSIIKPFDSRAPEKGIGLESKHSSNVYSIAEGTIISITWNSEDNTTVILAHNDGWVSVYKNITQVTNQLGDLIGTHEPFAKVGNHPNTSKILQGYINFQMWKNSRAVDPKVFIKL